MKLIKTFTIAYQSLSKHKVRTALTVLGIVIGVGAVIIVMAAGEGVKGFVTDEIAAFGYDIIEIEVKTPNTGKTSTQNATQMAQGLSITTLKLSDAEAISKLPYVKTMNVGVMGQEVFNYGGNTKTSMIFGTDENFLDAYNISLAKGSNLTAEHNNSLAKVVVLGYELKNKIFGTEEALGKIVKIRNKNFKVIGVLEERGASFMMDFDNIALVPVTTLQKQLMGIDHISFMIAKLNDTSYVDQAVLEISDILRERHNILEPNPDKYDFSVNTMQEALDMLTVILDGITLLLIAIASISLVVGGIGIMNIMYVSVSERTYEIGLRKAVGASNKEILRQFLYEAALVTFGGAIAGVMFGALMSWLIVIIAKSQSFGWSFVLPLSSVVLSVVVAVGIGLLFGFLPAKKASKLDPIEALRRS
ncbi:MAG: ABC transporter permease [Candidatus Komeilibacteria bacterium]